ncbi:nitroreductase [Campylobacter jejuni]|nr:nitroreductase [Campylobacter jejuni]
MIGGFEKAKVDDFLNLTYPFETAVILSLGYKAHKPKYSTQRLNFNEVVEFYKEK